jgi:hypothetical protein
LFTVTKTLLLLAALIIPQLMYGDSAPRDLILPANPPIYLQPSPAPERPSLATRSYKAISPERSAQALLERKLDRIVIPVFNIREATIQEAVQVLREAAKQSDKMADRPRDRGVNLVLKTISAPPSPEPVFTLRLENQSLREAIRHLRALSHGTMHVHPYAVSIVRH